MSTAPDIQAKLSKLVMSEPGNLITAAYVASALGISPDEAELELIMLANTILATTLTRRKSGWVFYPHD